MTGIVHALVNFRRGRSTELGGRTCGDAVRPLHILGMPTTRIREIVGYTLDNHGILRVTAVVDNPYDFGPDQIEVDARRLVIA